MSVATPWPAASRPAARSCTATSPKASSPPVTASTLYSTSSHSVSTATWIAWKIASTGPSPLASPTDSSPEGRGAAAFAHRLLARGAGDGDFRHRRFAGPGLDLEPGQVVSIGALTHLVGDDRLQV